MEPPERIKAWVWDLDYPSKKNGIAEWNATMFPADQDCHDYIRADLMAELVEALETAHECLLWCAREGRMASPNLSRYPERWADNLAAALAKIKEPQHG